MPTLDSFVLDLLVSAALLALGLGMLRWAWGSRLRAPVVTLLGWMASLIAVVFGGFAWGEVGVVVVAANWSLLAYLVVAFGLERRSGRAFIARELTVDPDERPTNWWRAIARSILAIVLAGVAAVGIGIAFAVCAPLAPTDRILIGGLLVPMLWGAGMAWTLCDARLGRATVLLLMVCAAAYGITFYPALMSS